MTLPNAYRRGDTIICQRAVPTKLRDRYSPVALFSIAAVVAVFLWCLWAFFGAPMMAGYFAKLPATGGAVAPTTVQELGQVGDLFGGVNALFAALAFAGVMVAAVIQHRTHVLAMQQQTLQAFEPLFFNLLDRHHLRAKELVVQATEGLAHKYNIDRTPGPAASVLKSWRRGIVHSVWYATMLLSDDLDFVGELHRYEDFYELNEDVLGPYFRGMYHLFNLVDRSQLSEHEKQNYSSIARAALGKEELFMLALNCAGQKHHGMRDLVNRYGLLKHASDDSDNQLVELLTKRYYAPTSRMSADERAEFWKATPISPAP